MTQISLKAEHTGAILALVSAVLWGIFPVVTNRAVQNTPPLVFLAASMLVATVGSFLLLLTQKKQDELKNITAGKDLFLVALLVVIVPYILFFVGASKTSGLNSSLLILSEIIFTVALTPYFGEKNSLFKLLGAGGVFVGAILIVYNGAFTPNWGDILVFFSTITYPFGNFYSKKALNLVSPATIIFVRFFIASCFFVPLAFLGAGPAGSMAVLFSHWPTLILFSLLIIGPGKIIWYEALKRLDISKAISLSSTFPLFSLFLLIILGEPISWLRGLGAIIMIMGVFFTVARRSVDPAKTKYAP